MTTKEYVARLKDAIDRGDATEVDRLLYGYFIDDQYAYAKGDDL